MRYAIVVEKAANNYSAYVPDLPGCIATGSTIEEIEREIREAIELHIAGMIEDGLPVPQPYPSNRTTYPHSFNNASIASGANGSNSSIRL